MESSSRCMVAAVCLVVVLVSADKMPQRIISSIRTTTMLAAWRSVAPERLRCWYWGWAELAWPTLLAKPCLRLALRKHGC